MATEIAEPGIMKRVSQLKDGILRVKGFASFVQGSIIALLTLPAIGHYLSMEL